MRSIRYWFTFVVLGLLIASAVAALAQDAGAIPQVAVSFTAEGFTIPDELPAGAVQITYENTTEAPVAPFISRLNEGFTPEDLAAAYNDENPMAAEEISSDMGGIMILPGMTLDVTYLFTPGNHVLSNLFGGEELIPFTVSEGTGAAAPEADLEIGLVDFAFNLPISISAGTHTIHLNNTGTQFHMMLIFRIDDALTIPEVHELLEQHADAPPEGVEEVASWFPMSESEQVWINLDMEPGTYLFLCPLPDVTGSGHTHDQLGMRQFVTVREAE